MTVTVTPADIRMGARGDSNNCPLCLAIERASGFDVTVTPSAVLVLGTSIRYRLPAAAVEWVAAYDANEPVAPFTFDLRTES